MAAIRLINGTVLQSEVINRACAKALEAIKNELPEEAQIYESYAFIVETCKEVLQSKKIVL